MNMAWGENTASNICNAEVSGAGSKEQYPNKIHSLQVPILKCGKSLNLVILFCFL